MLSDSGIQRLAISAFIVWILVLYFVTGKGGNFRIFVLFGLLPILIGWLVMWVNKGFKQQKKSAQKNWLLR